MGAGRRPGRIPQAWLNGRPLTDAHTRAPLRRRPLVDKVDLSLPLLDGPAALPTDEIEDQSVPQQAAAHPPSPLTPARAEEGRLAAQHGFQASGSEGSVTFINN